VEIVDTYCRTLIIASHLSAPLVPIPSGKTPDLLAFKKRLGLPDSRYGLKECELCDLSDFPVGFTAQPWGKESATAAPSPADAETMIQAITDQVMAALEKK
jgi:L-fuculose-phosphate aldolase